MDALYLLPTEDTPEVKLNPEENVFIISGRSLPENAIDFFSPVLSWFEEYFKTYPQKTTIDFILEYFNTASAKQIAKLLLLLENANVNNDILIRWHYSKDDSEMLLSGNRFDKLINIDFEFVVE